MPSRTAVLAQGTDTITPVSCVVIGVAIVVLLSARADAVPPGEPDLRPRPVDDRPTTAAH
ncbi:hypothetical protein BIU92_06935 [Curtobacterium sp. MCBA15_003]|nr:hypothetical protein BIU92_06935 [Curtobacterium sp. MCBA15_003]